MSITDPVVLCYNKKRETWFLRQDNETFYDRDRILREWKDPADAARWCKENLGVVPEKEDGT